MCNGYIYNPNSTQEMINNSIYVAFESIINASKGHGSTKYVVKLKSCLTCEKIKPTRSTLRAQTSATPSSKSVKQSTQSWNSVAYYFLCPYPENFMNVHPYGIPWCCQQTRTQQKDKSTLCPRSSTDHPQNVPNCSLYHSQDIMNIPWKSIHRFDSCVANKHGRGA